MYPRIKHMAIYPVKSCGGVELRSATLTPDGLESGEYKDHQFMVVSNDPEFIASNPQKSRAHRDGLYHLVTQRDSHGKERTVQGLADMALIKPKLGDALILTWKYHDPIEVPYDLDRGKELAVREHEDTLVAVDQGGEIARWLSDHLGVPVRLVKAAGPFNRLARQNYVVNANPLRFQDGYPIHWFSIESVRELSEIAGYPVPWQTFRPQIVAEGMAPQGEHSIHSGYISDIPFTNPKPCDRCTVTNVDQETGEVQIGRALAPLSMYKNWRNKKGELKVIFGENMLPEWFGEIAVGDELAVREYRSPRLVYGPNV